MNTILMIFCAMAFFTIWLLVGLIVPSLTTRFATDHDSNIWIIFLFSVDLLWWIGIPVLALILIL